MAPITQDVIEPGADCTYTFTVEEPAVGMYHAHLAGQIGGPQRPARHDPRRRDAVAEDAAGWSRSESQAAPPTSVAQEIPMVLNDAGVIGLSLNGKSFPATQPIVANNGDWLMVHY